MKTWILPASVTLICWGLWGFIPKITTRYISPMSAMIYETIGALIVGGIVLVLVDSRPDVHIRVSDDLDIPFANMLSQPAPMFLGDKRYFGTSQHLKWVAKKIGRSGGDWLTFYSSIIIALDVVEFSLKWAISLYSLDCKHS